MLIVYDTNLKKNKNGEIMSLPSIVHFEIPTEDIEAVPSILVNQYEYRLSQA